MRLFARWSAAFLAVILAWAASAHPLPNTLVTLKPGFGRVTIEIDTPAADLAIAMRAERQAGEDAAAIGRYYLRHVAIADSAGRRLPLAFDSARLIAASDPDVGAYREWRLTLVADAAGMAAGPYSLSYDAVIHQIPNHFALVRIDSANEDAAREVGVIRYDFPSASIRPLTVDLATGTLASGFAGMVAVGFVHVLAGLDHILFLIALLMVAPFEAARGRWRFRGMDGRAFRRFAAISIAFTIGHSISLAAGTFGFDGVSQRWTEILVALSIVIASAHAIRPLFPRREWLVAGGFGLIHGLAFSQALAALDLDLTAKLGALFGFNIGVEAAQLTVMAIAFPILAISGAPRFARPRQAALAGIAWVAMLWIGERAFDLPLPPWLAV